jgi:biotin transporter BioY
MKAHKEALKNPTIRQCFFGVFSVAILTALALMIHYCIGTLYLYLITTINCIRNFISILITTISGRIETNTPQICIKGVVVVVVVIAVN